MIQNVLMYFLRRPPNSVGISYSRCDMCVDLESIRIMCRNLTRQNEET